MVKKCLGHFLWFSSFFNITILATPPELDASNPGTYQAKEEETTRLRYPYDVDRPDNL